MIVLQAFDYGLRGPSRGQPSFIEQIFYDLLESEFFILILCILIIIYIVRVASQKNKEIFSHWNVLLNGMNHSTKDVYARIGDHLSSRDIPDVSFRRESKSVSHIMSAQRQYLVINWRDFQYEICAAPFADSFFVSYRMNIKGGVVKSFISKLPLVGWIARKYFFRVTYYTIDSANMFHSMVHTCIIDIVDEISKEKNIPVLTEKQKTPEMKDVFKR